MSLTKKPLTKKPKSIKGGMLPKQPPVPDFLLPMKKSLFFPKTKLRYKLEAAKNNKKKEDIRIMNDIKNLQTLFNSKGGALFSFFKKKPNTVPAFLLPEKKPLFFPKTQIKYKLKQIQKERARINQEALKKSVKSKGSNKSWLNDPSLSSVSSYSSYYN